MGAADPASPDDAPGRAAPRNLGALVPFLLFIVALALYANDLPRLPGEIFDEHHYVGAARQYTNGVFLNETLGHQWPVNPEHPPLGKYLIALSMVLWDDWELGWRMAPAIAAATGVAALYLIASRLFPWPHAGLLAAAFLLFEPMYYLHARLAILDIFATVFTLWAFAAALSPRRWSRPLSGAFLGLALATKYNALFLVPVFFLLHYLRTEPGPILQRIRRTVPHALLLPIGVLVLSYAHYFYLWWQMGGIGYAAASYASLQATMLGWNVAGDTASRFASRPWQWPFMRQPVWYYRLALDDGRLVAVYTVGNPALWWPAFAAAFYLVGRKVYASIDAQRTGSLVASAQSFLRQARFHVTSANALLIASILVLGSYLPWFVLRRITLMFYATYIVPFLALLAAGWTAREFTKDRERRKRALNYVFLVAAVFLLWYPFVSGSPMAIDHYRMIRLLVPWMRTAPPP